jgi:ribonuclease BN (tRNA processing enzyme)
MRSRARQRVVRDEIVFLGTADGLPNADRLHAAMLVRLAGATILLDCGEPCAHTLKRRGEDFDAVDAVFVTHCHVDHVGGLPMLLHAMRFEKRRRPLALFLPRRAIRPLRAWLLHCLIDERRLGYRIAWRGISTRTPASVGRVDVTAFRTAHLAAARARLSRRHPELCFDAYALLLEAGTKRLAYSGDLGVPEDLEPLLARPLDVLVTEAAHVDAAQVSGILAGREVGRVLVTHVARERRAAGEGRRAAGLRPTSRAGWRAVADGEVVRF